MGNLHQKACYWHKGVSPRKRGKPQEGSFHLTVPRFKNPGLAVLFSLIPSLRNSY